MHSEKRQKFVKLAESRTQLALDAIRKIGNLSNKRAYEYADDDVKKIKRALREALSDMESRFATNSDDSPGRFKL